MTSRHKLFLSTPSARRATTTIRNLTAEIKFLSTPSARRATKFKYPKQPDLEISIHALREEGDSRLPRARHLLTISIHALREEGDVCDCWSEKGASIFLSTPSARRATTTIRNLTAEIKFLSTPSARRATSQCCMERAMRRRFLSTPSARRATCPIRLPRSFGVYFYPRPPRGGRRNTAGRLADRPHFYPRPPRGGRHRAGGCICPMIQFLSTPSARRATSDGPAYHKGRAYFYPRPPRGGRLLNFMAHPNPLYISIHALREEGDGIWFVLPAEQRNFYPRPPRGGRRFTHHKFLSAFRFLSTPSARRATCSAGQSARRMPISIHALREEGDLLSMGIVPGMCLFLSTPSARRATGELLHSAGRHVISIHALREEGDDGQVGRNRRQDPISIHALREEGDLPSTTPC